MLLLEKTKDLKINIGKAGGGSKGIM